jgi:hypothetical protein
MLKTVYGYTILFVDLTKERHIAGARIEKKMKLELDDILV